MNLPSSNLGKTESNPSKDLVNPKVNSEAVQKNEIDKSHSKPTAIKRTRGRGRGGRGRGKWAHQNDPNQPKIGELWKKKESEGDQGNQSWE